MSFAHLRRHASLRLARLREFSRSQIRDLLSASGFQPSLVRKSEICSPTRVYGPRLSAHPASAEVVCFASDPPLSSLRFAQPCSAKAATTWQPMRKPSVCSPTRVFDPRLGAKRQRVYAKASPVGAASAKRIFPPRRARKSEICSAEGEPDGSPRLRAGSQTILKASFI